MELDWNKDGGKPDNKWIKMDDALLGVVERLKNLHTSSKCPDGKFQNGEKGRNNKYSERKEEKRCLN